MSQCVGKCKQFQTTRLKTSWYAVGVRCAACDIFISNLGTIDSKRVRCKCCNNRVRTKPKCKKYREALEEQPHA